MTSVAKSGTTPAIDLLHNIHPSALSLFATTSEVLHSNLGHSMVRGGWTAFRVAPIPIAMDMSISEDIAREF
jgi:hypothetical protein